MDYFGGSFSLSWALNKEVCGIHQWHAQWSPYRQLFCIIWSESYILPHLIFVVEVLVPLFLICRSCSRDSSIGREDSGRLWRILMILGLITYSSDSKTPAKTWLVNSSPNINLFMTPINFWWKLSNLTSLSHGYPPSWYSIWAQWGGWIYWKDSVINV